MMHNSWSTRLIGAIGAATLLVACGDDTGGDAVTTVASAPATSAAATTPPTTPAPDASSTVPTTGGATEPTGFPVTVTHALGDVTIESAPERVVALDSRDADTLLALGVVPVAIHNRYDFPTGVGPWASDLIGDAAPTVTSGRELNLEAIAAANPDLIVYTNSDGDPAVYDTLTAIAPTVALPEGAPAYGASPEQTTRLIAEALGKPDEGRALVDEYEAGLAARATRYPAFADATFNYLDIFPGGIWSYAEDNVIMSTMVDVGFQLNPAASSMADGASYVEVSAELLADYDADILLVFPYGRTLPELEAETPTLASLASVQSGRIFLLEDLAFSNASILSIPYALDQLLPQFDAALATAG